MKIHNFVKMATFGVVIVFSLALSTSAFAQAWLPPKGIGFFSIGGQGVDTSGHLFSDDIILEDGTNLGDEVDLGNISSRSIFFNADYGLTRRMALSGTLGIVQSKYDGLSPEDPSLDDGSYNGGLQDLSVDLRYSALRSRTFKLVPFAGLTVPTNDYETFGHTARGRNLNEFRLGANLGWQSRTVSPDFFIQARYEYAIVENVDQWGLNRDTASLSLGYFFTPAFQVTANGVYLNTRDGIDWLTDIHDENDFHTHDRAAKAQYTSAGIGMNFTLPSGLLLVFGYDTILDGENTHQSDAYTIGTSWAFGGGRQTYNEKRNAQLAAIRPSGG